MAIAGLNTRRRHRLVAPVIARTDRLDRSILRGGCCHFFRAQDLAMRTIAADFGAGQHDIESEMGLDLLSHFLQQIPEKFLDLTAAQTDDMSMLLLQARFVVVLVAIVMHQIELIYQS